MAIFSKPDVNTEWNQSQANSSDPGQTKYVAGWEFKEVAPSDVFNYIQNRGDRFQRHVNESGIAVWDASTTYSTGSICSYALGGDQQNKKIYQSKTDSNQSNSPDNESFWRDITNEFISAGYADATGTNALSCTVEYPKMTSYSIGQKLFVKIQNDNTAGDVNINVNSIGVAQQIRRADNSLLSVGDLKSGMIAQLVYVEAQDSVNKFFLLNPAAAFINENILIDGYLDFWQDSISKTITGNGNGNPTKFEYIPDLWRVGADGDRVATATREDFIPGQTDVPGNPSHFIRINVTGGSIALVSLCQLFENVANLSGAVLTLSAWCRASSTSSVGIRAENVYGLSGSGTESGAEVTVPVGTGWSKVSGTIIVPSVTGKTIGSGSYTRISLFLNSMMSQCDIAALKLEYGTSATENVREDYRKTLDDISRYYQKSYDVDTLPGTITTVGAQTTMDGGGTSDPVYDTVRHSVPMRAAPTVTIRSTISANTGVVDNGSAEAAVTVATSEKKTSIGGNTSFGANFQEVRYHFVLDARL